MLSAMQTRRLILLLPLLLASCASRQATTHAVPTRPNFIVFFVDNLGNGDVGCFGSTLHRTPHLDRMAAEGRKFTSFYVASGVCTPSRAALMTACYPRRVNLHVSDKNSAVLQPVSPKGLHPDEITIAEVLQGAGYATACIGKWHLGDQPPFLPTRQGFDHYFGIPYSDDMTKDKLPDVWPELPLLRGEQVIDAPVDRDYLVRRCTEEAVAFIERNRSRPFFLYIPHTMPGSTQHPHSSPAFRGKSRNGEYGDSVEELDWSTGEILQTLKRLGLDANTLVLWTSDNGAPRRNPPQGSCALRHLRRRHAHAVHRALARAHPGGNRLRRADHGDGSAAHLRRARRHVAAARPHPRRPRHPAAAPRADRREVALRRHGILLLPPRSAPGRALEAVEALPATRAEVHRAQPQVRAVAPRALRRAP
jgi:arylsulfatase A-like enzyme